MAFWGVEISAKKSAIHSRKNGRRLHVKHAILGSKGCPSRTSVQCSVGNGSPILLCALLPNVTESCLLDVEFDEVDDVIFSVVGGSSVHLTGYYKSTLDGEPFGEDIQHTDESSNRDDDDSFIDDEDDAVQDSLPSSGHVMDEDTLGNHNDKRKLRKKTQVVEDQDCKEKTLSKMDDSPSVNLEREAGKEEVALEKSESMIVGNYLEHAVVGDGKDEIQEQSLDLEDEKKSSEADNEKRVEDVGKKELDPFDKINASGQEMLLSKDEMQSSETKAEKKRDDNQNLSLDNPSSSGAVFSVKPKKKRKSRSEKTEQEGGLQTHEAALAEDQEIEAFCRTVCELLADGDDKTKEKKKKKNKKKKT